MNISNIIGVSLPDWRAEFIVTDDIVKLYCSVWSNATCRDEGDACRVRINKFRIGTDENHSIFVTVDGGPRSYIGLRYAPKPEELDAVRFGEHAGAEWSEQTKAMLQEATQALWLRIISTECVYHSGDVDEDRVCF